MRFSEVMINGPDDVYVEREGPRYRAAVARAEGRVESLPVSELPALIDELAASVSAGQMERTRREHCKNPKAAGQVVWVAARQWGHMG